MKCVSDWFMKTPYIARYCVANDNSCNEDDEATASEDERCDDESCNHDMYVIARSSNYATAPIKSALRQPPIGAAASNNVASLSRPTQHFDIFPHGLSHKPLGQKAIKLAK